MDLDDFRSILETAGVDVWTFIDTAILVASLDYGQELKNRRDNIVERLYATSMVTRCRSCDFGSGGENRINGNEVRENLIDEEEKENEERREENVNVDDDDEENGFDPFAGLFDDEQKKILEIKEQMEDPDLSEESLVELLQTLEDMDITFKALQETDIGRHVNRVRKHPSNNVRRLAKQLVRKWKETVDEWVKLNQQPGDLEQSIVTDGDSPQQIIAQNGHQQQVPDFGCSPNPQHGSYSSDKNNYEPDRRSRAVPHPPRKEMNSPAKPSPAPQRTQRERKDNMDLETATKRLQQNYRQAENAKKRRTIQVVDIHEIPKPKKGFFPKKSGGGGGGGGGSSHGRHW